MLRDLQRDGWREKARRGSYLQLVHPTKPGKVTLPHPKKDLPLGTVRNIYRQAGLPSPI